MNFQSKAKAKPNVVDQWNCCLQLHPGESLQQPPLFTTPSIVLLPFFRGFSEQPWAAACRPHTSCLLVWGSWLWLLWLLLIITNNYYYYYKAQTNYYYYKAQTNWKRCLLKAGKVDKLDFGAEICAIQLQCKVKLMSFTILPERGTEVRLCQGDTRCHCSLQWYFATTAMVVQFLYCLLDFGGF